LKHNTNIHASANHRKLQRLVLNLIQSLKKLKVKVMEKVKRSLLLIGLRSMQNIYIGLKLKQLMIKMIRSIALISAKPIRFLITCLSKVRSN